MQNVMQALYLTRNARGLPASARRYIGGHLKKAVVSATAEITVHVLEGRVGRKWNEEIGLNLLAFN